MYMRKNPLYPMKILCTLCTMRYIMVCYALAMLWCVMWSMYFTFSCHFMIVFVWAISEFACIEYVVCMSCQMQKAASIHRWCARKMTEKPRCLWNILQKVILCVTFIIGHGRSCLKSIPPLSLSMRWRWRWRLRRRWQQRRRWRRWKIHTSHGDLYTCKIRNV